MQYARDLTQAYKMLIEKSEGKEHLEYLGVNERVI
jgi:hypothetical protein